jgi:hypothetical protein
MFSRRGIFGVSAGAAAAMSGADKINISSASSSTPKNYAASTMYDSPSCAPFDPLQSSKSSISYLRDSLAEIEKGNDPSGNRRDTNSAHYNVNSLRSVSESAKYLILERQEHERELERFKADLLQRLEHQIKAYVGLGGIYDVVKGCLK